jgi:uncharacterized protein
LADRAVTGADDRMELLEAELRRFVEVASEEFGAERIIVFGSLARAMDEGAQTLDEWSDLDLVVVAETELPFYERSRKLLLRVRPRISVDVFVYTPTEWKELKAVRLFVQSEMVGKRKVVYERAG